MSGGDRRKDKMDRVTVEEAASLLGVSRRYIHIGIQRGFLPIGTCVKLSSKYTYHIPRERLNAYMEGRDIKKPSAATDGNPLQVNAAERT